MGGSNREINIWEKQLTEKAESPSPSGSPVTNSMRAENRPQSSDRRGSAVLCCAHFYEGALGWNQNFLVHAFPCSCSWLSPLPSLGMPFLNRLSLFLFLTVPLIQPFFREHENLETSGSALQAQILSYHKTTVIQVLSLTSVVIAVCDTTTSKIRVTVTIQKNSLLNHTYLSYVNEWKCGHNLWESALSTTWLLGIQLESLDWATSGLTHWPILPVSPPTQFCLLDSPVPSYREL